MHILDINIAWVLNMKTNLNFLSILDKRDHRDPIVSFWIDNTTLLAILDIVI